MVYNPAKDQDREELASAILATLTTAGFQLVRKAGTNEAIYSRAVDGTGGKLGVYVYTTVVRESRARAARKSGNDSIKVCALYSGRGGKVRGISKETRTHRVGEVGDITSRMLERMRSVYLKALSTARCSCGAPKFTSKAGHLVCADLCWLSDEEYTRPYRAPRRRSTSW